MRFATYTNINGGVTMIGTSTALEEVTELGHMFAIKMAELGHDVQQNDLLNGLAAYSLLNLKGENKRMDAAIRLVMKEIASGVLNVSA